MRLGPIASVRDIRHAHMFCGVGVGARGFNLAAPRVRNVQARFVCVGGIDVDAGAIRNFEKLTGTPGTVMDLFSREQYIDFHGKEPPAGWREATPADIRKAYGPVRPDVVFLSAPCKGFSGLLSATQSKTDKYQALNGLTLRGVWLLLEAYKDDPIPIILFENVPRILTRGNWLLDQIQALYRAYGYSVNIDTHDCGVIGGLAQSRKRALMIARHMQLIPPFIYQPKHHKLRGVGEVIGQLPLPGDPVAGTMHRVPALQWKTWVRLAFVPAGKDWRALNELAVVDGALRDFGIVPEVALRDGALGVNSWSDSAPVITTHRAPGQGRFSVADPRVEEMHNEGLGVRGWSQEARVVPAASRPGNGAHSVADPRVGSDWQADVLGVRDWHDHSGTIPGRATPTNGVFSVADPRQPGRDRSSTYGVKGWGEPAGTVAGESFPTNGAFSVADPRPTHGPNAHQNKMKVVSFGAAAPTITGSDRVGSGALSVADPRPLQGNQTYQQYGVKSWNDSSVAVSGQSAPGGGPYSVADPRPGYGEGTHQNILAVTDFEHHSKSVTGAGHPAGGALSVADPRVDGHPRSVQLGVRAWDRPAACVKGDVSVGTGPYAVSDPRIAGKPRFNNVFRIVPFEEASPAVAGPGGPAGGIAVADPRPEGKENYMSTKYKVTHFDGPSRAVIGASTTGDGAFAVADPRGPLVLDAEGRARAHGKYPVADWQRQSPAVIAGRDNGAFAVADPRGPHEAEGLHGKYPVSEWDRATRAVIAGRDNGAFSVADPRAFGGTAARDHFQGGGHYGVIGWRQTAHAVPGSANHDNGFNSVADPREADIDAQPIALPKPDDRLVCRIIATDGTWHRPFTTLDLAALQSLFDPDEAFGFEDGIWFSRAGFELDATSDVTKREWIGNAVPGAAATSMAHTIGETILLADMGETFMLDTREIWVKPLALALAVNNDQAAFDMEREQGRWMS